MASATPALGTRRRPARPSRQPSRRGSVPAGIRWDRLGRVALLLVLFVILLMYVRPAVSWVSTLGESKDRRAELRHLQSQNARLKARKAALTKPATLEREARKLGMVRPGERAFVIDGLPRER